MKREAMEPKMALPDPPWGSGSGSPFVLGSDSGSASGSAAGSSTELEGGARGAGREGENWDPSKVRLPKSTVNLRHHTDSHFRSDTFMWGGRESITCSLLAAPRIGASEFLYS